MSKVRAFLTRCYQRFLHNYEQWYILQSLCTEYYSRSVGKVKSKQYEAAYYSISRLFYHGTKFKTQSN